MPSRRHSPESTRPLLDLASYARRGPAENWSHTRQEVEFIARTVRRTPEVMVKVLSKGGQDLGAVQRHFDYLSRKGELELETDEGRHVAGDEIAKSIVEDWDLDLEEHRRQSQLAPRAKAASPKLVHKIVFSMPAGTPPEKLMLAVRTFCREEFGLRHRYALVLHTDEPHPHVHVVLKAMGEQGERLNIRKADLRAWRREFARQLRAQGVAANATERAARGVDGLKKKDGVYRAMRRGQSTHMRALATRVVGQLSKASRESEAAKPAILATRAAVLEGWNAIRQRLSEVGDHKLASEVQAFTQQMPPPRTDWEQITEDLETRRTHQSTTRSLQSQSVRSFDLGSR